MLSLAEWVGRLPWSMSAGASKVQSAEISDRPLADFVVAFAGYLRTGMNLSDERPRRLLHVTGENTNRDIHPAHAGSNLI